MSKAQWVKWKKGGGPRVRGTLKYNPAPPHGPWTKIMGVVARCEGSHDTVVMYDETGVTFGFMQWTFKSGRLQKLLESFKSIPNYDFTMEGAHDTLFDAVCRKPLGSQVFEAFGFRIERGKFVDTTTGKSLNMNKKAQQKRCVDICMGRVQYPGDFKKQKQHAMALARLFAEIGREFGVADAQVQFAIQEFKRQMMYKRSPLGGMTIAELLNVSQQVQEPPLFGDVDVWSTPLLALFFNLWQNNPGAAYRLFLRAKKIDGSGNPLVYFQQAWKLANRSKFGNWGWGKPQNKSPRVVRIKKAVKEFYGSSLQYYK